MMTITYSYPQIENQNDPAFHTDYGHSWVASVSDGTKKIDVYCDGEMRIHDYGAGNWANPKAEFTRLRYSDDLIRVGVKTDDEIFEANENGRFDWVNNSWFDLYDETGEWYDCVTHDLQDAINEATKLLEEYAQ